MLVFSRAMRGEQGAASHTWLSSPIQTQGPCHVYDLNHKTNSLRKGGLHSNGGWGWVGKYK